jgi:hypothetical protein
VNDARESETFEVGQVVLVQSVNSRGRAPQTGVVTRVGRKLVYVEQYGREQAYRIHEGGRRNDGCGHEWVETGARAAKRERRNAVRDRLRELGFDERFATGGWSEYPIEKLEKVIRLLEETDDGDE